MADENSRDVIEKITAVLDKVVVGKEEIKQLLLAALLARGHLLIEGLPGTAKTTIARTFAGAIGGEFKRVQGTPDMLPADVVGFYLYRSDGGSAFMPGPIFANVVLVDELNRLSPRTQAALLEAMAESQVTIERETHRLKPPFIVVASQVPYGGIGTSLLSDVQIDRFMFRAWSGAPNSAEEDQVLRDIDIITEPDISPVTTPAAIVRLQEEVKEVHVDAGIRQYIVELATKLRSNSDLVAAPSPRGSIALFRGARALAFINGRDYVIPDDVKQLIMPVFHHRLHLSTEAEMENVTPESIIKEAADSVAVPRI